MSRRIPLIALALLATALAGCGPSNPVLGDWEMDRRATPLPAVLAVEVTALETLSFDREGARSGETVIPGDWIVEEGRVRLVREDGRGEHAIELLPDDRIRVDLPIGVAAVYKRAGA
jgi:hypothetical protein